jgi:hypothetical protein
MSNNIPVITTQEEFELKLLPQPKLTMPFPLLTFFSSFCQISCQKAASNDPL